MSQANWLTAISGDWADGALWSTGAVPDASTDVSIAVAGVYSVAIDADEAARSLLLDDPGASVRDSALLSIGTSLSVTHGNFALSDGGAVSGGTFSVGTAGTLSASGGGTVGSAVVSTGHIEVTSGTLRLLGGGTLASTVGGAGTLALAGATRVRDGADLAVAGIVVDGALTFVGDDSYAGTMSLGGTSVLALTGGGTLALSGALTIAGAGAAPVLCGPGTLVTSGTVSVAQDDTFLMTGLLTWLNSGIVTDAGRIDLDPPRSSNDIINQTGGVFDFAGDDPSSGYPSLYSSSFSNAGTLEKSSGTGTTFVNTVFENTGSIVIATGTLELNGTSTLGGTISGAGTLALAGVSTFDAGVIVSIPDIYLAEDTLILAGDQVLPEAIQISGGGALDVDGNQSLSQSLALTGGQISVASGDTLTLLGRVDFDNGVSPESLSGPGTIVTGSGVLIGGSESPLYVGGDVTWSNDGTVTDSGRLYIGIYQLGNAYPTEASIINQAGGIFDLTGDASKILLQPGDPEKDNTAIFSNAGTLERTGGDADSRIDAALVNTGLIAVDKGTIELAGGGTLGGTITGAGTLAMLGGSVDIVSGTALSVSNLALTQRATLSFADDTSYAHTLTISDSTLSIAAAAALSLGGVLDVGAGNCEITGPGTLLTAGIVSIENTDSVLSLGGGLDWSNSGTVTDAAEINLSILKRNNPPISITNLASGVFDLTGNDSGLLSNAGESANFSNAGTLEKTGSTRSSAFDAEVTNSGLLTVQSGTLILASGLSNSGELLVSGGGVLDVLGSAAENMLGATLNQGIYVADADSTIKLSDDVPITTDSTAITLDGNDSKIEIRNTSTGKLVQLESSLATITSSGIFNVLGGRDIHAGNAFVDDGVVTLGGGIFREKSVTIGSGGIFSGFGTIMNGITDNGTLEAIGGTLTLDAPLRGAGVAAIAAGATLDIAAADNISVAFAGAGAALELDSPASMTGALRNFVAGDSIVLPSDVATSAMISNGTLGIELSDGEMLNYAVSGTSVHEYIGISADGHTLTAYYANEPNYGATLVDVTPAEASAAAIIGTASASTTLDVSGTGTVTLNPDDSHVVVNIAAGDKLNLGSMGFITGDGAAGDDVIVSGAASQTLLGGASDALHGFDGGGDIFAGSSAALNGDVLYNWTSGDVIDLTDINSSTLQTLNFTGGRLQVSDGTESSTLLIRGLAGVTLTASNFVVLGSDGHGGTMIGY